MSERSNTSRSFASRDYDGRKNVMGEEKGERMEGPMGPCGTLARDLRLSFAHVSLAFFSLVPTLFLLLRFF